MSKAARAAKYKSALRRRTAIARATLLRPGERLIASYAFDCAPCECVPTHMSSTVPSMPVATGNGVDRCVRCGAEWTTRWLRSEPTTIVKAASAPMERAA